MTDSPTSEHSQDSINDDDEISLLDLLGVLAENLRLLIIGPIILSFIVYAYTFTLTPTFTAKTTIIPPGQNNASSGAAALLGQLGGLGALAGDVAGIKTPTAQYISYLESNTLCDQLIDQFKLMEHYQAFNYDQARHTLRKNSLIATDKKSGLILIQVSDRDPQFAANLANGYVGALSQMLGKMALEDAKYRRQLLEQQINDATEKSYRSPLVREAIIQAVVREYEAAILDQKKDRPYIQQVDLAEVPSFKSKPKQLYLATITALATVFLLLLFVFVRHAFRYAEENPETKARLENIFFNLRRQLWW